MTHRRLFALTTSIAVVLTVSAVTLAEPIAPAPQPLRENDDIYAELDDVEPLPEFTVTSIMDKATLAQQIALGIGVGGLAVSTLTVAGSMDEPTTGAIVLSGVTLGLSVLGFATAGIIELLDEDEPVNVAIAPGFVRAGISF